jgi:hypothetical protein
MTKQSMAWIERFTCDICGKQQASAEEKWWIATNECAPPLDSKPDSKSGQPTLKLNPWDNALAHSADSKHLCGAGCAHTYLDRWMAGFRAGTETCVDVTTIS